MKTRILAVVLFCIGGALPAAEKADQIVGGVAIDLDPVGSKVRISVGAVLCTRCAGVSKSGAARNGLMRLLIYSALKEAFVRALEPMRLSVRSAGRSAIESLLFGENTGSAEL